MNDPIEIDPDAGPLTVYVVAVLFVRRVSPTGALGVGFGAEEVLLQHQFSRPGEEVLSPADAAECGIQHIREQWAKVMGPQSDPRHFAVSRANVNGTVVRPAEAEARTCRQCGCTDDDCRQCVERIGMPCAWVEYDLCSACVFDTTHDTHCCKRCGCKYGDDDCPVALGRLAGIAAEACDGEHTVPATPKKRRPKQ